MEVPPSATFPERAARPGAPTRRRGDEGRRLPLARPVGRRRRSRRMACPPRSVSS